MRLVINLDETNDEVRDMPEEVAESVKQAVLRVLKDRPKTQTLIVPKKVGTFTFTYGSDQRFI